MSLLGITFLAPLVLLGLLSLPILWWLLRAVPPAPLERAFPAVVLLLGLEDRETTPDRTPWWLLLLRVSALAAAILAFAQPVLNPSERQSGSGPLLIAMDASWASAQSWSQRQGKLTELLDQARQAGRPVALIRLGDTPPDTTPLQFLPAVDVLGQAEGLRPNAWEPDYVSWRTAVAGLYADTGFDTIWFSDGLLRDNRRALLDTLGERGTVNIVETAQSVIALRPARIEDGLLRVDAVRSADASAAQDITISAFGPDPAGITRKLISASGSFAAGESLTTLSMDPPSELRNRVRVVSIDNTRSAGTVVLGDDSIRRRKVALIPGTAEQEGIALVSPLHFLRKALVPTAEVIEAGLTDSLLASPDVVVLADVGTLSLAEAEALRAWVDAGGTLVRFAGPQLAASQSEQREQDPLLPVRLRAGGRSVGGTMSWGAPKTLRPFDDDSPFAGLSIPDDVTVSSQVMAQPDPELANRVMATLADGTPLVTGADAGAGRIVLFHVTANAEWSTLPLSGLFVQMLERLAISTRSASLNAADMEGFTWVPQQMLDGFGDLAEATALAGVDGAALAMGRPSATMPPGLYASGTRMIALNTIAADRELQPVIWPNATQFLSIETADELRLQPWLLMLALGLLALDILATLALGGRLRRAGPAVATVLALILLSAAPGAQAQTEADTDPLLLAANNTVLAYVKSGDAGLDARSNAGLLGLSAELFRRTSVEPVSPIGVDLERDDITLYPFLYWPVSASQPLPSDDATAKVNAFLRNGGLILFDTRDANLGAGIGAGTPNGRRLQQIAAQLIIPPLEPVPSDHVLTRAFYLLQHFPGRHARGTVWVEAAPPDAEQVEGIPFRNLNDGVTPVVVGAADWASAWAIGDRGQFLYPVGRGNPGELQREYAFRFGINLIMHVLTGNYKSDQVHVPALLDRLGQ